MIAFLQNRSREDTSTDGAVGKAGQTAKEVSGDTFDLLREIRKFGAAVFEYLTDAAFISSVLASVLVVVLGLLAYRVITRGVPRVLRWRRRGEILDAEAVERIKRQDTAITLIRNALRYVVFIIVVLVILSIFIQNPLPATAGATLLAAVIGFGAQSFLRDVIAGFSIVFEGQYSVGDFVQMEPTKVAGIVEEFGLRTTTIQAVSGERIFVPNGTLMGVTNYVSGQRRYTLEVQLRDNEAASRVLESLGEAADLYLTPPRLARREDASERIWLSLRANVLPTMEWLVEENLVERIKAAAGEESLAAEPLVYKVDRSSLTRIRNLQPPSQP